MKYLNFTTYFFLIIYSSVLWASQAFHSSYLKVDSLYDLQSGYKNSLWMVGRNIHGQLGDGSNINRIVPVQIDTNVSTVARGYVHTLYIKPVQINGAGGILKGMGHNQYGQLGDGTNIDRNVSVQIDINVTAISAGSYHSLYLKNDGTLRAVGKNEFGQLGNGTTVDSNTSVFVDSNVSKISAGHISSFYIKTDGSLWGMGNNHNGMLGTGNVSDVYTPVKIADGVCSVYAEEFHCIFIKNDATLWAMGYNGYGQLGDGTTKEHHKPIQVTDSVQLDDAPTDSYANVRIVTETANNLIPGGGKQLSQIFTGMGL